MNFRWTINELKEITDKKLILSLIAERKSNLTNIYAPLYRRLSELEKWVENNLED